MIFIEYLVLEYFVLGGERHNKIQNHRIWEVEGITQKKINKIYGLYSFSIQNKNSFIESHGKNVLSYLHCLLHWLEECQWEKC